MSNFENKSIIVNDPAQEFPPLLLVFMHPLNLNQLLGLREGYSAFLQSGRMMIFDNNPEIYQLQDGRWEPLRRDGNSMPETEAT